MCIYSLILAGTSFFRCAKTDFQQCSPFSPAATIVLVLFLLFEGVLFAIFTMIMFASQIHAIWNDETVRHFFFIFGLRLVKNLIVFCLSLFYIPSCASSSVSSSSSIIDFRFIITFVLW